MAEVKNYKNTMQSKNFVVNHEVWFMRNFKFIPTQTELESLFKAEQGAAMLLLNIFSKSHFESWKDEKVKGYW